MAHDRVEGAVSTIMRAIFSKEFQYGDTLPPEADLADWLNVSRPTMREAIKILSERGIVRVVHGRGAYIQHPDQWTDFRSTVAWLSHANSPQVTGMYLVEIRRMIEVGACGLAAERRDDEDIAALERSLAEYDEHTNSGQLEEAARIDLQFHNQILSASKNPLLPVVMAPLAEALQESRALTTEIEDVRDRARYHHRQILDCIIAKDATGAKTAMRSHMSQTQDDILNYLAD